MYMLQLFDKTNAVHPIDARLLREGVLRIGRDAGADWPIADPLREVSRWHCEVEANGHGLSLRSLGANGVFDDQTGDKLPDGEPVDLPLPCTFRLGSFRIAASHAPQTDAAVDVARTTVMTPPLGTSLSVPTDWSDADAPRVFTEGSLLEAFCEGAGLDASLLSTEEPTEIMRRAGAVYRQMVLGIGDLMAERERARARYQLTRTTIGGANNNPFKWAPTQRLAIDLLLAGSHNFLSGPGALKASFQDIKRHLVATFAGLQGSLRRAVDSFDPAAIETAVAPRVSLFKNRGSLHADEVAARHKDLIDQLDEDKNGSLSAAFVAAYDEAERRLGREA